MIDFIEPQFKESGLKLEEQAIKVCEALQTLQEELRLYNGCCYEMERKRNQRN